VIIADQGVDTMTTPVFERVRSEQRDGVAHPGGEPPRHPDIYRELCAELGRDVLDDAGRPTLRLPIPEQRRASPC
jgi:hypothetical protein